MGTAENIEQQRALYGEPLGALVPRVAASLGLSQAATARILGLSPAMLSHLVTGQRVKIANPAALSRLQALVDLGQAAPLLSPAEVANRLDAITALSADLTTTPQRRRQQSGGDPDADAARVVRDLLRAVASGRELEQAAAALAGTAPGIADMLRIYGTGTEPEMREHLASLRHLMG